MEITCKVTGPDKDGKYWANIQPSATDPLGPFNTKQEAESACINCLPVIKRYIDPKKSDNQ